MKANWRDAFRAELSPETAIRLEAHLGHPIVLLPVTSVTIVPVRPAMTTALNDRVVVDANGLVSCCAWCLPLIRLAELHRAHRCTDGLCSSCSERLDREVA